MVSANSRRMSEPVLYKGGLPPLGSIVPINFPDKRNFVEELVEPHIKATEDNSNSGRLTWILAIIGLPIIGICALGTIFILTRDIHRPLPSIGHLRSPESHKYIFIIDINRNRPLEENLPYLENCIRKNKNCDVYSININKFSDQPRNTNELEVLKKKYQNFHYLFQSKEEFFKGSIFEKSSNDLELSKIVLFKAQLLILWRYGGLVIQPDWSPLKSLEREFFLKEDDLLKVGTYHGKLAFLSAPNNCNAKVFDLMRQVLKLNSSSPCFENDVIDRVFLTSPLGFKRLSFPYLCNNNTMNGQCLFLKGRDESIPILPMTIGKSKIPKVPYVIQAWGPQMFKKFYVVSK